MHSGVARVLVPVLSNSCAQRSRSCDLLTHASEAQLFTQQPGNRKIIGVVGELQFEVIQYRLEHEYNAKARFDAVNYHKACWMTGDEAKIREFIKYKPQDVVLDKDENLVYLAQTAYLLQMAKSNNPDITFHETSEFKTG